MLPVGTAHPTSPPPWKIGADDQSPTDSPRSPANRKHVDRGAAGRFNANASTTAAESSGLDLVDICPAAHREDPDLGQGIQRVALRACRPPCRGGGGRHASFQGQCLPTQTGTTTRALGHNVHAVPAMRPFPTARSGKPDQYRGTRYPRPTSLPGHRVSSPPSQSRTSSASRRRRRRTNRRPAPLPRASAGTTTVPKWR